MTTKLGIHLPNAPFTQDSFDKLIALGPLGSVTVLHEQVDTWLYSLLEVYQQEGWKLPVVHIRFLHADVMYDPAEDRARGHAEWILQRPWLGRREYDIQYSPGNELNLEDERRRTSLEYPADSEQGYHDINDWMVEWHYAFKARMPNTKTQFPAFSPGHGEDELWFPGGSGMEICREAIALFDVYGQHSYWNPAEENGYLDDEWYGWRWKRHLNELERLGLGNKTIFVSEVNRPGVRDGLYGAAFTTWMIEIDYDSRVIGATHFIWDSESFPDLSLYQAPQVTHDRIASYIKNSQEEEPMPEPTGPVFVMGFKDYHDMHPIDVGDVVTNEYSIPIDGGADYITWQETIKGRLRYHPRSGVQFMAYPKSPLV